MRPEPRAWLMKSEPDSYGIEHLKRDTKTPWTGVRNYQARNFMREMRVGDRVLFYHSSCKEPGVYGEGRVASLPYPDPTQFEKKSDYYDPRSKKEHPLWSLVDVAFVSIYPRPVLLSELRADKALRAMKALAPGSRLSVTAVTRAQYAEIARRSRIMKNVINPS